MIKKALNLKYSIDNRYERFAKECELFNLVYPVLSEYENGMIPDMIMESWLRINSDLIKKIEQKCEMIEKDNSQ